VAIIGCLKIQFELNGVTANYVNIVFGNDIITCFDIGKLIKAGKAPKDCEHNCGGFPFSDCIFKHLICNI